MSNDDGWDGEERRQRPVSSALERHMQTGFAVIITGITAWVGLSLVDLGKEQVKTSTQLQQVRDDMRQLQTQYLQATQDRYTASEARRDQQEVKDRLDRLEHRK